MKSKLVEVKTSTIHLTNGDRKCLLCAAPATHRMAYGARIHGKQTVCFICHCARHASPYDEVLATLRDVQAITRHALINAADPLVRTQAKKDLAKAS